MHRSLAHLARLAVLVGVIVLGVSQYQQASAAQPQRTSGAESPATLIWQGKLLPIVTDVYGSIGALGTGLQNRDVDAIAKVSDEFAAELQRFEAINPTPSPVRAPAKILDRGLRNLNNGTKALVVGLRASDNAAAQRAAQQVVQGLRQFQQGIDQLRRLSGPLGLPTPLPGNGTPIPTPVIKGLP